MPLPTDAAERKRLQLYTFMFKYFPDAWLAVVDVARVGNDQHNPGEPLHWAREKSTDQMNAAFNHIFDYGLGTKKDTDGQYHLAKSVWRQMAQLQLDIEADRAVKGVDPVHGAPLYYVIVTSDGQFWRAPMGGTTSDLGEAYLYTREGAEAQKFEGWTCEIRPAP